MAELDHVLLADGAVQRSDGKIDVFGAGFDTIYAPDVPVRHPQLTIIFRVLISAHEAERPHEMQLILMGEDGEVARATADFQVPPEHVAVIPPGEKLGVAAVLDMPDIVFPAYGRYHVAVLWDGTEMRQPIALRLTPVPSSALGLAAHD